MGGPLLLVTGRGTKKEADFLFLGHVLMTLCGGWIRMSLSLEFANSSQTSEPSAKVTAQDGWSVSLWPSLELGASVHIEDTLNCGVSYPVSELDLLLVRCALFLFVFSDRWEYRRPL